MSLTPTDRGTGSDATMGTSIAISPTSNCTAGALAWVGVAYDNSGTNGADPYVSISDSHGNTWTSRQNGLNDPGANNEGVACRIFTTDQAVATLTTGSTITVSFGSQAVPVAVWTIGEVTASSGTPTYSTGGMENDGNTSSPSITTGTITSGDVVIGVVGHEGTLGGVPTQDGDTSNGTWSTQQATQGGSGLGGQTIASQAKVTNGTATQTYNPTLPGGRDVLIGYIVITEVVASSIVPILQRHYRARKH